MAVRALAALILATTLVPRAHADQETFNQEIRPLLSDRCFACHGPDAEHRAAGLRLDDEAAAKEYAIIPGDAASSEVYLRITSDDPDYVMPPPETGKPLSAEEIDRLTNWIDQGAPYALAWAYQDPVWHSPPATSSEGTAWARNWIDVFVRARLEEEGVQPSPEADPATLVRRLSYDLTGLPPDPETVARFCADPSGLAYSQLVDQMLNSPEFGERLAVMWFDLVRYADTVGYHGDQDHNIAPYRDWVIDALNANMPFDEFTRYQLAGDLLENSSVDARIASGYNRLLQTSHEGGVQPKEYMAIYAADRVRNVSAVWMGATLGCAQCHDHKFDPFTARDHYAMAAFFADIDEAKHFAVGTNALPTRRPPEIEVLRPWQRDTIAALEADLSAANDDQERTAELQQAIERVRSRARMTMVTVAIEPREIRVLPRGNWLDDSGPVVEPAVPEFFGRPIESEGRATRLDLANWLTDPEQYAGGLTARVMVNRYWNLLFGRGLSQSLDDFGGQGEPPSHPHLLDNLAVAYYRSGWDTKRLIRDIVHSSTYRQSSLPRPELAERDPANRLLARQGRHRLPAEMIRDTALDLGGLLVRELGGRAARPYQPAGYYRHLNFPPREYSADSGANQYRRGVYVHWQRQFLHPMLRAFDAPTREECTARRSRSNTPLAALVLMNDPTFVEASRALAVRLLTDPRWESDDQRIEAAFRLATGRDPDAFEHQVFAESLERNRQQFADHPDGASRLLEVGLYRADPALDPVDLAAWSEIARTLLNLSETQTRP